MRGKLLVLTVVGMTMAAGMMAGGSMAAPPSQPAAAAAAATTAPATPASAPASAAAAPAPDVLQDAVDPLDLGKERGRFFTATGPDGELSKDDFAAARGKAGSFVRIFDSFDRMLAFDKDKNGTIDWFEAQAYRENIRQRVLEEFDADKDGKLAGPEREKANRALAAGRLPGGEPGRTRDWWAVDAETLKKFDTNSDGQLSAEERQAMWRQRLQERQKEWNDKYDADHDGQLDEAERKAMREQTANDWMMHLFDRNRDGQLDEAEQLAVAEAQGRFEDQRRRWEQTREELIRKYDADGNGRLEGDERLAAWEELRQQWARQAFDQNGDGQLDEQETAAMRRAQEEMRATFQNWQRDWVKKYDADGDGQLSPQERQAAFEQLGKEFRAMGETWRQKWDADGDGVLSPQEEQAMRDALRKRGEELRKELDADGDGRITGQEMQTFWQKLRQTYDVDGDGVLSQEEMKAMLQDQMNRVGPPAR